MLRMRGAFTDNPRHILNALCLIKHMDNFPSNVFVLKTY